MLPHVSVVARQIVKACNSEVSWGSRELAEILGLKGCWRWLAAVPLSLLFCLGSDMAIRRVIEQEHFDLVAYPKTRIRKRILVEARELLHEQGLKRYDEA